LVGEAEVLGENLPQRHFAPSQNPTWPDPGLNPGRRGGKPANNRVMWHAKERREMHTKFWQWNLAGGDYLQSIGISWIIPYYFENKTPSNTRRNQSLKVVFRGKLRKMHIPLI
jgi:hypothetical protein